MACSLSPDELNQLHDRRSAGAHERTNNDPRKSATGSGGGFQKLQSQIDPRFSVPPDCVI